MTDRLDELIDHAASVASAADVDTSVYQSTIRLLLAEIADLRPGYQATFDDRSDVIAAETADKYDVGDEFTANDIRDAYPEDGSAEVSWALTRLREQKIIKLTATRTFRRTAR